MRTRRVFGSKAERKIFSGLQNRWSDRFNVYHNLPMAQVIEIAPNELDPVEESYFFKTSVDFVVCDKEDRPRLLIEFDGIGGGHSKQRKYVGERPDAPHNRQWKMDKKLHYAHAADVPMVVIGYEESEPFDQDSEHSILHCVIASVFQNELLESHFDNLIEENLDELEQAANTGSVERQSLVDWLGAQAETRAEFELNPMVEETYEMILRAKAVGPVSWSERGMTRPEGVQWDDVEWFGGKVEAKAAGQLSIGSVWMRNLDDEHIFTHSIVEKIAEYRAWKGMMKLLGLDPKPAES